jgi:hypothetical protein
MMLLQLLKTTYFDLDIYNDDFFEKLSGVTNALDNVEARKNINDFWFTKMGEWSTDNHHCR